MIARVMPSDSAMRLRPILLGTTLVWLGAAVSGASVQIRDLDGRALKPFEPNGAANVILFVATDCPIANGYAPEIQRICRDYRSRGVGCSLMYEDVGTLTGEAGARLDARVRTHLAEYGYQGIPAAVDRTREVARHVRATVTPQAVVVDRQGTVRYSGRINNFYAALGRPRQVTTVHDLRDALDAVLAGTAVPRPETDAIGCYIVDPALLTRPD
jgi:hypothetical protein